MGREDRGRRLVLKSGLVPVDLEAEDLEAEIVARQDKALEEAYDKARDETGGSDFKVSTLFLSEPFEVKGRHYVSAALTLAVEMDDDGGEEE